MIKVFSRLLAPTVIFQALVLSALSVPGHAGESASRRIIIFKADTSPSRRVALAESTGAKVVHELPLINAVSVEAPPSLVSSLDARLAALREVSRVDPDPKLNWLQSVDSPSAEFRLPDIGALMAPLATLKASAPPLAQQAIQWGVKRVDAPAAWAKTRGAGVKVAVIDTGLDRTHPDLAANIKGGWNAISKSDDFNDDEGHGTHCGGNIAALDNEIGVAGVAPEAELYGVKVLDLHGAGWVDDIVAGMQWAVDHRMDVVSMSLGVTYANQALPDMATALKKAGVTLVAAAGNNGDGTIDVPGAYPESIAVAASDEKDLLADFSSRGPAVAEIAPGVNVYSLSKNAGYEMRSGTSMATPHVAGLAALYISTHKGATPDQVRAALSAASTQLSGVIPEGQGAGLPSALKLVR
jgi:subtilisin